MKMLHDFKCCIILKTPLYCGTSQESVIFFRIIEWFVFEGIFTDHLVQCPCHGQGYLSLDQVAQSPVQPDRTLPMMGHE